jgi:cell division protein FtsL
MTAPVLDPVRPAPARRAQPAKPQAPARTPRPHLHVLRDTENATEAERARLVRSAVVLAVAIGALCLFGVVVFHVLLTQNQFRLDKLQEESIDRQAEYDRLRLQVAELESPDRNVAAAQQLGMVTPPKVTYLAPTVEETPAPDDDVRAARLAAAREAASAGETSWSTVKPHLADG